MDLCPIYKDNIRVQDEPGTEMTKFRDTEAFQKLRRDVSIRIGYAVPPSLPLSDKNVLAIYEECRFEKAWFPEKPSPWCAVSNFTTRKCEIFNFFRLGRT